MQLEKKITKLKRLIHTYNSVLVAYSGGVDSTFLAKVAYDVLGEKALAITAVSKLNPKSELEDAVVYAREIGIQHDLLQFDPLRNSKFIQNDQDRCYYCKYQLLTELKKYAQEIGNPCIIEGSNADDVNDFRPGFRAIKEFGISSPLLEAGLTKSEIRLSSKHLGLPTWDKPALACLSTRLPYGEEITESKLKMIEMAEDFLKKLGFRQVRIRTHDLLARVEISTEYLNQILEHRGEIVKRLQEIGYLYVSVDLAGYRTGSMNETLRGIKQSESKTY